MLTFRKTYSWFHKMDLDKLAIPEDDSVTSLGTENKDEPQDYTSLKRSLSRITSAHSDHAEHAKAKDFKPAKQSQGLQIDIPGHPIATELAFAALQYLPTPLIVLSSLKTVLLANEAMGRLLGLRQDDAVAELESVTEVLKGQTLSQIGIDMLQDGAYRRLQITVACNTKLTCLQESLYGSVGKSFSRTLQLQLMVSLRWMNPQSYQQ